MAINACVKMDKADLQLHKTYYDARFGAQSQRLNEEESIRLREIRKLLRDLRHTSRLDAIADFGCGRGWLSNALQEFGRVTGFDLSEQAVRNAASSYPTITFRQLNAQGEVPAEYTEKFSLVVSSEVLEHIGEQQVYIRNAAQLLTPGGFLLLTTPNGRFFREFYSGRESWKQPLENWRDTNELKRLLSTADLSIIKYGTFNSQWIFDLRPGLLKWLSMPLMRKALKLFRIYPWLIEYLDRKNYGINIYLIAQKKIG